LAEEKVAKTGEERANELLRSGRLVFLETAGYTAAQITGLGDLAAVTSEKMSGLLHKKALEAMEATGRELNRQKVHTKILRPRKKAKRRR
jgi:hypothetical protein